MLKDKKIHNIIAWNDTKRISDNFPFQKAIKYKLDDITADAVYEKPVVKVFHHSMLEVLGKSIEAKLRPLTIINANNNYPIENLKKGFASTECDLFRCSNIRETLNNEFYPLTPDEIIYVSQGTVFKNTDNVQLTETYQASFGLFPAVKSPSLINVSEGSDIIVEFSNQQEKNKMQQKIHGMFQLAQQEKFNCLILPDFGCQLDNNPIIPIIRIFNTCINQYGIKYVFFYVKTDNLFENIDIEKDKNFQLFNSLIKRQ
jgi:hypothetical protein